jgi:hypothetical protein
MSQLCHNHKCVQHEEQENTLVNDRHTRFASINQKFVLLAATLISFILYAGKIPCIVFQEEPLFFVVVVERKKHRNYLRDSSSNPSLLLPH